MTAIAGLVDSDGVCWLGGDSAIDYAGQRIRSRQSKVRRLGGVVVGVAGDAAPCDVVMSATWPRYDGRPGAAWVGDVLVPVLRRALRGRHLGALELLVGLPGMLCQVDSRGACWSDVGHPYAAVGSGAELALGALYASQDGPLQARERVLVALRAAESHRGDVAAPFRVVHT